VVRLSEIASFIEGLDRSGIMDKDRVTAVQYAKVQCGEKLDRDLEDRSDVHFERDGVTTVARLRPQKWHIHLAGVSRVAMVRALRRGYRTLLQTICGRTRDQKVYRAKFDLGVISDPLFQVMLPRMDEPFWYGQPPSNVALNFGPNEISPPERGDEAELMAGVAWIEVRVWGQGKRGITKPREVVERIEGLPEIAAMMELCRKTWPADVRPPSAEQIAFRKELGDFWAYELDRPVDWSWLWQG
jgi:hypothetical protein